MSASDWVVWWDGWEWGIAIGVIMGVAAGAIMFIPTFYLYGLKKKWAKQDQEMKHDSANAPDRRGDVAAPDPDHARFDGVPRKP